MHVFEALGPMWEIFVMRRGFLGFCAIVVLVCAGAVFGADDPDFCEKLGLKKTAFEDVTVYYEPCFEEKLPAFEKAYKEYRETTTESRTQKQASVQKLVSLEEAIIEDINDIVGADGDLKTFLKEELNSLAKKLPLASGDFAGKGSIFYLVLQSTSKDYLRAGGALPNYSYDKESDTAHCRLNFGAGSNNSSQRSENMIPISSVGEFETEIHRMFSMVLEASSKGSVILEYLTIHEIAELAIVRKMNSADPYKRWFTDGFANAVTYEVILRNYSQEAADAFLADYSTEPYTEIEKQSNLRYWMSAQFTLMHEWPFEKENEFNYARYCFATREAKRLVDTHGIEIVGKILKQYAGLKDKDFDSLTSTIQKVTGEDPRQLFEKYQSFQTREEGLARYTRQYEQAMKQRDVKEMIFSMLRMIELCEQPFSKESLNWRKNIATLLYLTGQRELGNQFITEFADIMGQSKDANNRFVGRHLVVLYALGVNAPEVAYGYAQQNFEDNPKDFNAAAVVMHRLSKENKPQEARKLAEKICEMEPDVTHPCHQMAKQVLSETKANKPVTKKEDSNSTLKID